MKRDEVMGLLLTGKPVMIGEFRRVKSDVIRWRDKTTRDAKEAPSIRYTVECANETYEVSKWENLPDGQSAQGFVDAFNAKPVAFKKGQQVVVQVDTFTQEKGIFTVRGELYPLEGS